MRIGRMNQQQQFKSPLEHLRPSMAQPEQPVIKFPPYQELSSFQTTDTQSSTNAQQTQPQPNQEKKAFSHHMALAS